MTSRPVLYFLISVFSNLWYTLPFPRKQDSLDQKIPTFVIDCRLFRDVKSGLILFDFGFQQYLIYPAFSQKARPPWPKNTNLCYKLQSFPWRHVRSDTFQFPLSAPEKIAERDFRRRDRPRWSWTRARCSRGRCGGVGCLACLTCLTCLDCPTCLTCFDCSRVLWAFALPEREGSRGGGLQSWNVKKKFKI